MMLINEITYAIFIMMKVLTMKMMVMMTIIIMKYLT